MVSRTRSSPVTTSTSRQTIDDAKVPTPPPYLLQNVKVLAVGVATVRNRPQRRRPMPTTPTTPSCSPGSLTFEVTSDDALRVIEANTGQGKPYLVLLPPKLGSSSGGTAAPASGSR